MSLRTAHRSLEFGGRDAARSESPGALAGASECVLPSRARASARSRRVSVGRACLLALASLVVTTEALALPPFGSGARDLALAGSDVADPAPGFAARLDSAAAAEPGTRVALAYGYAASDVEVSGTDAQVADVSGVDLGLQAGFSLGNGVRVGGAVGLYLPDSGLARIVFRPASAVFFPIWEGAPQRTRTDFALAFGWNAWTLGVGLSALTDVAGDGILLDLSQDERGAKAQGDIQVSLPYALAPFGALRYETDALALSLGVAAPNDIELAITTDAAVDISGNPLNGTTRVRVTGSAGYEPLTATLAGRLAMSDAVTLFGALEYARWSAAPPPVAKLELELALGLEPEQDVVELVAPRWRDTLSPRVGVEVALLRETATSPCATEPPCAAPAAEAERAGLLLRAGAGFTPSPVPKQPGLTSYADADRATLSAGAGYHVGRVAGVGLELDAALQYSWLAERRFDKASEALPNAHYTVAGDFLVGSLGVTAVWR